MAIQSSSLMLKPNILARSRILITGGGTGLGRIMAEGCAALGARVYISGRRSGVLETAAAEINAAYGDERVSAIVCDIRSVQSIADLLDTIWSDGGALTGLVNNAAANFVSRSEDLSVNGFDAIVDTVLRGTFLLTHGCGTRWLQQNVPGAVVSILTTWVINGAPFGVPAGMAKAGLYNMTQSLAVEWGNRGIRLNAICPGAFPTEGANARLMPQTDRAQIDLMNPMRRNGTPQELINIVTFLLAPGSEFISGQLIAIDGAGYQGNGANFSGLSAWSDEHWSAARAQIKKTDAKDKAARSIHPQDVKRREP